ncbi:uncharacterized protein N7483_009859 [Penicillium malachiteum]|uniref:uncharacterized protein n=1 Tax=Penicillium malachiteum TaxID=1324776 RepID=UPI0025498B52|nr:uncharacterized protein N7483_009859 [Penicillium malachiteum]KAJ5721925.1 hypothetical protein N7483_009859 [Penicillium malachiteum]
MLLVLVHIAPVPYFEHVHPIYPFLHREEFEKKALDKQCLAFCQESASFSALYHAVLALGCQRREGGCFQPGQGTAWKLFKVAFSHFPNIIASKETLVHAQAIFARNTSWVQIEKSLTTQAARIVQALGLNRAMYESENIDLCQRIFWVTYILEKTQSFICDRDSVCHSTLKDANFSDWRFKILVDSNIGIPAPQIPEAVFDGFDSFRALCSLSRLLSKAQSSLFTISATLVPNNTLIARIEGFEIDLDRWQMSIVPHFRPGCNLQANVMGSLLMELKLKISFHYYSAVIALARLKLSILPEDLISKRQETAKQLLHASRAIIDLTRYIDVETSTPIWILLSVPLSAIFILFDFVIHNPSHEETKNNIALMGVASGYFCRVEFSSNGRLQFSLLSDLAQIARDYIQDVEAGTITRPMELSRVPSPPPLLCEGDFIAKPWLHDFLSRI